MRHSENKAFELGDTAPLGPRFRQPVKETTAASRTHGTEEGNLPGHGEPYLQESIFKVEPNDIPSLAAADFSATIKHHLLLLKYLFILGSAEIQATESLC